MQEPKTVPSIGSSTPRHKTDGVKAPKVKSKTIPMPEKFIVAYLKPKSMSEENFGKFVDQAAHDILARFGANTIVVGLEKWSDLRILDEAELERIGYVHTSKVFLLKKDVDTSMYTPEEIESIMSTFVSVDNEEE